MFSVATAEMFIELFKIDPSLENWKYATFIEHVINIYVIIFTC